MLSLRAAAGIVDHLSKDELAKYDLEHERELQEQEGRSTTKRTLSLIPVCNPVLLSLFPATLLPPDP